MPSASHRQTDEGKHCAPGPPGLAAAGQRRKTEKTTFHNAARDNFTHSNPPPPKKKPFGISESLSIFQSYFLLLLLESGGNF